MVQNVPCSIRCSFNDINVEQDSWFSGFLRRVVSCNNSGNPESYLHRLKNLQSRIMNFYGEAKLHQYEYYFLLNNSKFQCYKDVRGTL
jgi:hypothetical protein